MLIESLLENLLQYGAIAALVVFQPELRLALSRLGQSRLLGSVSPMPGNQLIDEIVHGGFGARPEEDRGDHRHGARGRPRRIRPDG